MRMLWPFLANPATYRAMAAAWFYSQGMCNPAFYSCPSARVSVILSNVFNLGAYHPNLDYGRTFGASDEACLKLAFKTRNF